MAWFQQVTTWKTACYKDDVTSDLRQFYDLMIETANNTAQMRVWIQRADYVSDLEEPVESQSHVLKLFDTYDWSGAVSYFEQMAQGEEDCCPPGLGVVGDFSKGETRAQ